MAEICTSVVSPQRGSLKPSARCGKGWGSQPIHAVGQSLLVSGAFSTYSLHAKAIFLRVGNDQIIFVIAMSECRSVATINSKPYIKDP